jgi:hypothetical protein
MLRHHLVEDEIEGLVLKWQCGRVCHKGLIEMEIFQDPRIQVDPGIPSAAASEVEHVLVSSSRAGADFKNVHLRLHERGDLLLERILLVVRIAAQPELPDRRPKAFTGNRLGFLSHGQSSMRNRRGAQTRRATTMEGYAPAPLAADPA